MEIRDLNNPNNYYEWDELQYDAWEMFENPVILTAEERRITKKLLEMMKIDLNNERLISFRGAPIHFANLCVQMLRLYERLRTGKIWPKFFFEDNQDVQF